MPLPVGRLDRCIRDWISAVDHHPVSDINTDMAGSRSVIGATEKDQISGLCFTRPDGLAVVL